MRTQDLSKEVREAIAEVRPLEAAALRNISVPELVSQFDLRADRSRMVAHIGVTADSVEDAVSLNGRVNLYNGPTLYRVQCALDKRVAGTLDAEYVRLQVLGPDGDIPITHVREKKDIERVDVFTARKLGIIPRRGVVFECCAQYGLPSILLRNGQVIGPSPDLALVMRKVASRLARLRGSKIRVFDPFAGTHLASAVLDRLGVPAIIVAQDRLGQDGTNTYYDAFADFPDEEFDLVIVDPLFEDVLSYLARCLPRIKCNYVLVESGNVADVAWNRKVRAILDSLGTREEDLERATQFGKCVYVYRRI